ncbi:MAG: hypothetical protein DHS20C16_01780 [Phycisphaerae bacterium]|nr:MAG: hypothetical protein DHS20C16_01780 [Phycisphaerae bacterium]
MNLEFKKRMSAPGRFYLGEWNVREFPDFAAACLKYKKHEWIMIGFVRHECVSALWTNKGPDRTTVGFNIDSGTILKACREFQSDTLLVLHNHPNSNPQRFSTLTPSEQDEKSARILALEFVPRGYNLIEFVCERGMHIVYFASYAENFFRSEIEYQQLELENEGSWWTNCSLNLELFFLGGSKPPGGNWKPRNSTGSIGEQQAIPTGYDWINVKSSAIKSVGYDSAKRLLAIEFQSGFVSIYKEVPWKVFKTLEAAPSKGRYFNSEILGKFVEEI